MAVLQLHFWPAEILRVRAEALTPEEFTPELVQTLEDMAETMYVEQGIGLAAPQVGISKRMLVVDVPVGEERVSNLRALINPEIVEKEGSIVWEEGCLSFPSITAEVTRANRIRIKYQNPLGEHCELVAEELEAVCLQHELDHLNGVNFVDYLSPLKRKMLLRELKKHLADEGIEAA
ncbi:MAG TPA: peptide deformylase [Myxococcales bacterium]|nr:peptide deformylase [Myxococcales bacterium]HIN85252.1 peptide deformylase [Myxococcales bacterium]